MNHFVSFLPAEQRPQFEGLDSHQLHIKVPPLFKLGPSQNIGDFFTFSFVRHPFERLISAFKDKVAFDQDYKNLHFELEKIYGSATFPNFLRFVLKDLRRFSKCKGQKKCRKVDVHWRPFFERCAYCDVNYDFIGRMETFEKDLKVLMKKANLTLNENLQAHKTQKRSQFFKDEFGALKASQRAFEMFQDVDKDVLRGLYGFYSPDFDLFHYSLEGFPEF